MPIKDKTNPVDEYLMEKKAGYGGALMDAVRKSVGPESMGPLLTQGTLTAGAIGALGAAKTIYQAMTKKRDFEKMMDSDPDLDNYRQQNPKLFMRHYDSLRSMNPVFASDPIVSASYMRFMSESPHRAGHILVESIGGKPPQSDTFDINLPTGMKIVHNVQDN